MSVTRKARAGTGHLLLLLIACAATSLQLCDRAWAADHYQLRVSNIDDRMHVNVNDRYRRAFPYKAAQTINLDPYLRKGRNLLTLTLRNYSSGATYGYRLYRNGRVVSQASCGVVTKSTCPALGDRRGVVWRRQVVFYTP